MYRRQSSEEREGVRLDSLSRSCLLHCHNLRTVPPALAFPFTTVPPTNICQNDPPQYKSGEKRSSGKRGPEILTQLLLNLKDFEQKTLSSV